MIVICTLLFSKFDSDVRKDVLNAAGRDSTVLNGTEKVMTDFEYMKNMVELVKRVDDQNRPSPMDLGSFCEVHDHAEYVSWNDQGAPDWPDDQGEWTPDGAQDDPWPEETHRLAAIAEAGAEDIVLVAGKGHETGQIIGSGDNMRVLPFDDVDVARECVAEIARGAA